MEITIELFFQVFNTILIITIPACVYRLIKKFILHRKSMDETLTNIEKKLDNLK